MRRVPTFLMLALAGVALAVLAAGCGGSKSSSGVANLGTGTVAASTTPTTTTAVTRQDFQTAVLAYTKCLRSQGIQIADPNFSQGGGGGGGAGGGGLFGGSAANRNDPKFRKAQAKCRPILAAVRPQFSPANRQAFQDAALKFAQCMRKNGVNVPDPNFSGGGGGPGAGGGGLFGGANIDRSDPKVQAAIQTCRSAFTGLGGRGGGGFGPPGGGAPGP